MAGRLLRFTTAQLATWEPEWDDWALNTDTGEYFKGIVGVTGGIPVGSGGTLTDEHTTTDLSTATTLDGTHAVLFCNGTFTVTLPLTTGIEGREYTMINVGTGVVTAVPTAPDLIQGEGEQYVFEGSTLAVLAQEPNWRII